MPNDSVTLSHGGYRELKSFQATTIIYDLTNQFCKKYVDSYSRTTDQMIQAARSGRQNIAEGSQAAATSKKSELKLVNVARASLEELLLDYEDFLRQNNLSLWAKDDSRAIKIRSLAYQKNRSHKTYLSYLEKPESAANCLVCLIHQANYLLDQQIKSIEKEFLDKGGFSENLYRKRVNARKKR
ncbi:MAG: hypothetical protein XD98_0329 [Microgenomates bacterium 39_6]|nr:MAG: hypothetical protein XD98_0329 [Microgenomates bacterium 39_6]